MSAVIFDLDDTLYKEIDYLKSAFREIASYAIKCNGEDSRDMTEMAYQHMMDEYTHGRNAFDELNRFLNIGIQKEEYLEIYRKHKPNINLSEGVAKCLSRLKTEDCRLGLITDGRSIQQRHKIEALGLYEFIKPEDIVISEEFGSEKPAPENYAYFMKRYPNEELYLYVGDNPQKDFVTPNRLGWLTVGLLNDGRNIHVQQKDLPHDFLPKLWIVGLMDLTYKITNSKL